MTTKRTARSRFQLNMLTEGEDISYGGGDQSLSPPSRAIYIGTTGALKVDLIDGGTVTFANMAAGTVYWVSVTKIYQSGSTAAGQILR